ncbi:MAG: hypothetical protein EP343_02110 [Deltaproteobacteria bacterium]|nr:MAG: hypothetical protein EP343_02110 [Deltaproteobacteria bacterium]
MHLEYPEVQGSDETFDWRLAPVPLQDAHCTNRSCGTYKQTKLARLQFQTRPSYPVQVYCQECKSTWHSVQQWFGQLQPLQSEVMGLLVVTGSLAALPFLPWDKTYRTVGMVAMVLAMFQIFAKLWSRSQRKRAYSLLAELTSSVPFYHDALNTQELQRRLTQMSDRFNRDMHRKLLAFLKRLKGSGLRQMQQLRQSLLLHNKMTSKTLQRRLDSASWKEGETTNLRALVTLLQHIEQQPDAWLDLPLQLKDTLDSLEQALIDWPQAASEEAKTLMADIQLFHEEGVGIVSKVADALGEKEEDTEGE